jgi:hypothetical protein
MLPQNFGHRADIFADDAGVPLVSGRRFGNHAGTCYVMIPPRQKRRASWRAKCGGVITRISKTFRGDSIQRRRRHLAAKCSELTITSVIDENHNNIRRTLGWLRRSRELRRITLANGASNVALVAKIFKWQNFRRSRPHAIHPIAAWLLSGRKTGDEKSKQYSK